MNFSDKKIEELKLEIKELKELISNIQKKITLRVDQDIDKYEMQTEVGRRRVDKIKFKDHMLARKEYKIEIAKKTSDLMTELFEKKRYLTMRLEQLIQAKEEGKRVSTKIKNIEDELELLNQDIAYYMPKKSNNNRIRQILVRF